MPYTCCVPQCRGNYKDGPKVHTFGFPTDPQMCEIWVCALHRENFTPTMYTRVCELHFVKEDFICFSTATDSRTGETITVPLKNPRLKKDAIPTQFPNCTLYLTENVNPPEFEKIECEDLAEAISASLNDFEEDQKLFAYKDFQEFVGVLDFLDLPKNWFKITDSDGNRKVTLFKIKYSPGPIISYSIVISSNLRIETYLHGQEIQIPQNNKCKDTTPFISNNLNEITDLLFEIDKSECENFSNDRQKNLLNHISSLLDGFISNTSDKGSDEGVDENQLALNFISEQLKLRAMSKDRYRYSNNTIILTSILHTISPHAYDFLRHFGVLVLPHQNTIKSVCSPLLADPTYEGKTVVLTHAKNLIKSLSDRGKHVLLLIDEIHIKPYLDYTSGNIESNACNDVSLANSAFVFTIASVMSSLKEIVHISPTSKIDHLALFSLLKSVIMKLEEIGYKVFCVISNNNAVNSKCMCNFANNKVLSIVYPHPVDKTRPLFYLFDSVHLLKCIRNNWLNSKPDQILNYPDFDTGLEKVADFQCLKLLHKLEHHKLSESGYSLNLKAVFPTNIEKQNVSLVLQIFNPFIMQALFEFSSQIDNSKETAEFIKIIVTWWKIVNVKTPLNKGKSLNDEFQEPITANNFSFDKKFLFLNRMLNWLEEWKSNSSAKKLTNQTYTALTHTIYGMIEVVKYCFTELKMKYVLLGKFQTDELEHRFGKYRQIAGGQYHISIRQLYETEKRLRIESLLTLKSRVYGNIEIKQFYENIDFPSEDQHNFDFNPFINIDETDLKQVHSDMPVITYLASYCCYIILKTLQCEICKQGIVYNDALVVEDNYTLIKNFSRGKLPYPQDLIVQIVLYSYVIFNKVIFEHEETFLNVYNKRSVLVQYILNYITEHSHLDTNICKCRVHSSEHIATIIITCSTNTLLKNYCGKSKD